MRSSLRLLAFSLFVLTANAHAVFPLNPLMTIRPDAVTAQVYNPYYEPIVCEGFAFGQTYSGHVFQARVADIIPPGGYRYAVVSTNAVLNPFVGGWAQLLCNFLR